MSPPRAATPGKPTPFFDLIIGTRPEAIKMAPLVIALRETKRWPVRIVVTAQHRDMLDDALGVFGLKADIDFNLMEQRQSLPRFAQAALGSLTTLWENRPPRLVMVQGDTTTAFMGALAAYYQHIPVAHVEAGLRSHEMAEPFPEELNRRAIALMSRWHFAPTAGARLNLLKEGVSPDAVFVTGNTGLDALQRCVRSWAEGRFLGLEPALKPWTSHPFVLITAHRRENFGAPLKSIFRGIVAAARRFPQHRFLYPVHPNPEVCQPAYDILGGLPNVALLPPLSYASLTYLLMRCVLVVTDSGGLQEEAPSLGKPVLVLRRVTERPEAVSSGTVQLVGTDGKNVATWIERLLTNQRLYRRMAQAVNPYGDGQASRRIVDVLRYVIGKNRARPRDFVPR